MTFHPEINVLSIGGKYRPMYRLQPTDRWCLIRRDRKPVECETAFQARKIAQDLIDAIVDPVHMIEDDPEPLGSVEEFHRRRDAEYAAERARAFGDRAYTSKAFVDGRYVRSGSPKVVRRRARA